MAFDWQVFFDQRGIDYAEKKSNIYIKCPFCGNADEGHHMGVSVDGKGWGCWRDKAHRGRNPQRLVQAILKCSWAEAGKIVGKRLGGSLWGAEDGLGMMLAGFEKAEPEPKVKLKIPREFTSLMHDRTFVEYVMDRGFTYEQVNEITVNYNLFCARSGDYTYRIIIPIRDETKEIVTWSGRAINDNARIRYKTLTHEPEKLRRKTDPLAHGPITDYLMDQPGILKGGKFLVIVEGPFDVLKLSLRAFKWSARVTCLFGKVVSDSQLNRLADLTDLYDAMFLLLDPEASADAMKLGAELAVLGVVPVFLTGKHDPGDMTPTEMQAVFGEMADAAGKRIRPFAFGEGSP